MSKNSIISIIFLLATLGLSFWFWTLQKAIIAGGINSSLVIQSVIVFIVVLVLVSLNLMISGKAVGILMAMTLPGMFLIKFGFDSQILLGVAVASFVLGVVSYFVASREKSQRTKLVISSAKGGVGTYFFAGLLLLTAILYQTNFSKGELKLSESNIRLLMPFIEGQIKSQVPFYSEGMTTEEILVISALSSGEITITPKDLSKDLQNKIQSKISKSSPDAMREALMLPEIQKLLIMDFIKNNPKTMTKLRADYGEKFGIKIDEGQSVTRTLTEWVNMIIGKIVMPFKVYLPIVLAVTFFFSFKVLGFLFVDIALLIGGAIFLILKTGGVLGIKEISVMRETIED